MQIGFQNQECKKTCSDDIELAIGGDFIKDIFINDLDLPDSFYKDVEHGKRNGKFAVLEHLKKKTDGLKHVSGYKRTDDSCYKIRIDVKGIYSDVTEKLQLTELIQYMNCVLDGFSTVQQGNNLELYFYCK